METQKIKKDQLQDFEEVYQFIKNSINQAWANSKICLAEDDIESFLLRYMSEEFEKED